MFDPDRRQPDDLHTVLWRTVLPALLLLVSYGGRVAWAGQTETGELRIEGGPVERLVLLDGDGRQRHFDRPEARVPLAPGRYRLHEVALPGSYVSRPHLAPKARFLSVDDGVSTTLTLGAPLRQRVRVERCGTLMVMRYELMGQGGERYAGPEDADPPTFVVRRGNRVVASGRFQMEPGGAYSHRWRPPIGVSGQLSLVPSYDLGILGRTEGESTLHRWPWFHRIPGLPLWIALALALLAAPPPLRSQISNLKSQIALVVLVYAGWSALAGVVPVGPQEFETSRVTILALAVGMVVLWLLRGPLTGKTWARGLLGAMAVTVGIVFLGAASLDLRPSDQTIRFVSVLSVLMSAAALGHVLAWRTCRRGYGRGRFVLSLGAGTVTASVVAMFAMIATWCTTCGQWLGDADYILWLTFFVGPALGISVFVMSLLFALVGLRIHRSATPATSGGSS